MVFNLDSFNKSIQNDPMYKNTLDLVSSGIPMMHVVIDQGTGDIITSENGAPFERAHPYIKAIVNGTPLRDPGNLNPVASGAVRLSPHLKAAHEAEMVSMMKYLIDDYRVDLLTHPALGRVLNEMLRANDRPVNRKTLMALDTNYERWEFLLFRVVDYLDGK